MRANGIALHSKLASSGTPSPALPRICLSIALLPDRHSMCIITHFMALWSQSPCLRLLSLCVELALALRAQAVPACHSSAVDQYSRKCFEAVGRFRAGKRVFFLSLLLPSPSWLYIYIYVIYVLRAKPLFPGTYPTFLNPPHPHPHPDPHLHRRSPAASKMALGAGQKSPRSRAAGSAVGLPRGGRQGRGGFHPGFGGARLSQGNGPGGGVQGEDQEMFPALPSFLYLFFRWIGVRVLAVGFSGRLLSCALAS